MTSLNRRSALIAIGGLAAGLIGTSAIGATWLRDDRQPSLTLLGSGRALSVLLASGGARLLLVQGADYTDFGNALSSARYPMLDRIDLLLTPGASPDVQVVEHALRQTDARNVYSIGSANALLDAGIAIDRALLAPHRITLPGETDVELDMHGESVTADSGWSMLVTWRTHQLLIDSGGGIDTLPSRFRGTSAWIRTSGGFSIEDVERFAPMSIFVSAEAMEGSEMRDALRESGRRIYGYRVHDGDIARLELAAGGLRLPGKPASDP